MPRVRFWIRSSRGTDYEQVVEVPHGLDRDALKERLEGWCEQFGAWHVSGNAVSYGHEATRRRPMDRPRKPLRRTP